MFAETPLSFGGEGSASVVFTATGAVQTFVVPSCVNQVRVECWGAQGSDPDGGGHGGMGGYTVATIWVTPGETLYIFVGNTAGFNGGGSAGTPLSGGGASDVRQGGTSLNNRVVVAGGGGATGTTSRDFATAKVWGPGKVGELGVGGEGGTGPYSGGGGGGGYFGGGGGAAAEISGSAGGGGGGGSSFAVDSATDVSYQQSTIPGDGKVRSFVCFCLFYTYDFQIIRLSSHTTYDYKFFEDNGEWDRDGNRGCLSSRSRKS